MKVHNITTCGVEIEELSFSFDYFLKANDWIIEQSLKKLRSLIRKKAKSLSKFSTRDLTVIKEFLLFFDKLALDKFCFYSAENLAQLICLMLETKFYDVADDKPCSELFCNSVCVCLNKMLTSPHYVELKQRLRIANLGKHLKGFMKISLGSTTSFKTELMKLMFLFYNNHLDE